MAENEEADNRRRLLPQAMGVLSDRERRIFAARRLADDPTPLEELANELGISRERVRQIEASAFDRVQKAVLSAASKLLSRSVELAAAA
jgi:RNA polymerase sigma-32 factor